MDKKLPGERCIPPEHEFEYMLGNTPAMFHVALRRIANAGEKDGLNGLRLIHNAILQAFACTPWVPPELGAFEPVDPEYEKNLSRFLSEVFYRAVPRPPRPTNAEIETDLNRLFATENPRDGGELIWD